MERDIRRAAPIIAWCGPWLAGQLALVAAARSTVGRRTGRAASELAPGQSPVQ
jgi:hypothetical protein